MEPVVAVQTLLLRAQLPELPLRPGASVVARVLSRGESHGVLVIAGVPLTAQLPPEIGATGETLRLSVQEVTPERVTLALVQPPVTPEARAARLTVQEPPRRTIVGGEERSTVALSFHSPALGRLDLRLELSGSRVSAAVEAPAGRAFDVAEAAADRLQEGLQARTGRTAAVRITARREPLDLYA